MSSLLTTEQPMTAAARRWEKASKLLSCKSPAEELMDIILIEDDKMYADYLVKLLGENPDYTVTHFMSVEDFVAGGSPEADAYVVDYKLPGRSGIEFYEEMKTRLKPDSKFILMSGIDDGAMVLDFIKKGVRDYVIKDAAVIDSLRAILEGNDDFYLFG